MTHKQTAGGVGALAVLALICGFLIWRNYTDEEQLFFFEKADGQYWRPIGERKVWVS